MSLGGHWLNMGPFGMTFGTLRLHLDPICGFLGAFLVSLGVILETLGSILGRLGHLNDLQNAIWNPKVIFKISNFKRQFLGFCCNVTFWDGFLKWCCWILR